jgi:hypothetical protein
MCNGSGTNDSTVACFFAILFFLFSIFNTVFLIQELASVPVMKRFLTSKAADSRADAADLAKERSIHPWRTLDSSATRRHSISVGASRPRLMLADVSAPATPSEVYARAASAAAAAAGFVSDLGSPSFQPTITSSPIAATLMPPPLPRTRPTPSFSSQSTSAAAASWHARAAAAREARRPAWTKPSTSHPTPPSAELIALADRFRSAASAQQAQQLQQQIKNQLAEDQDTSDAASFYSAVLQNHSFIDNASVTDTVQPPLTPVVYDVSNCSVISANATVGHAAQPHPHPPPRRNAMGQGSNGEHWGRFGRGKHGKHKRKHTPWGGVSSVQSGKKGKGQQQSF